MNQKHRSRFQLPHRKFWPRALRLILILGFSYIPVRLAIANLQAPQPQAILVLGGQPNRIPFAAEFWHSHRQLPLWVSDDTQGFKIYQQIFKQAGVPSDRLHYELTAQDTVTNFTTTVDDFKAAGVQHVYLLTSEHHMLRAIAIATLVFGSQGIAVTPIAIPSPQMPKESAVSLVRDSLRSLVWIFTGRTGASLRPRSTELSHRKLAVVNQERAIADNGDKSHGSKADNLIDENPLFEQSSPQS
jgi:uncharacterized SAM-binding protein YcdF (DUF218 family)